MHEKFSVTEVFLMVLSWALLHKNITPSYLRPTETIIVWNKNSYIFLASYYFYCELLIHEFSRILSKMSLALVKPWVQIIQHPGFFFFLPIAPASESFPFPEIFSLPFHAHSNLYIWWPPKPKIFKLDSARKTSFSSEQICTKTWQN